MSTRDRDQNYKLRRIGTVLPAKAASIPASSVPLQSKSRAASYSETKQNWAEQVASDTCLPTISLRIALAWPKWLNRETLIAWPAQSTIADLLGATERTVRRGMQQLEQNGHLECVSTYRGGRDSNRYRIVLQGRVIDPEIYETGQDRLGRPDKADRGDRTEVTGQTGSQVPGREGDSDRGTPERTLERTKGAPSASADDAEDHRGSPVTRERAAEIMREKFGDRAVSATGHLFRK